MSKKTLSKKTILTNLDHLVNFHNLYGALVALVILGLGIRRYPQMILVNGTSKRTEVLRSPVFIHLNLNATLP